MNPKIIASLNYLKQLSQTVLLDYILPDRFELDLIKKGLFYCLNDKSYSKNFPEEACFADTEWLCSNEGAVYLTEHLPEVTVKRPFCAQFIGLSGRSYLWFQPSNYSDPKALVLCSLGDTCRTLVVHNIAADRQMFTESFTQNTNEGPNFFCTMSAHLLCAGVSDQQSFSYTAGQEGPRAGGLKNLIDVFNFWSETPFPEVFELSAKRGTAQQESKKIRDIFYKGSLADVNAMLPELIQYGMQDVNKVLAIFKNLYPAWLDALPSVESQYFYLKRAKVNYAIPTYFKEWFLETEAQYQAIKTEIQTLVKANNETKVKEFLLELEAAPILSFTLEELPAKYKNKAGTKVLKKWDNPWLLAQELNLAVVAIISKWNTKYPAVNWKVNESGYPIWYLASDDSADSPICQLLLEAVYNTDGNSYPITFDKVLKFVYITESNEVKKIVSPKKGQNTKDNCGSILSKDFIPYWDNGVFQTDSEVAKTIVDKMRLITYWTSVRSRLAELVVLQPIC